MVFSSCVVVDMGMTRRRKAVEKELEASRRRITWLESELAKLHRRVDGAGQERSVPEDFRESARQPPGEALRLAGEPEEWHPQAESVPVADKIIMDADQLGPAMALLSFPSWEPVYRSREYPDILPELLAVGDLDLNVPGEGIHADDLAALRRFVQDCLTCGRGEVAYRLSGLGGRKRWLQVTAAPLVTSHGHISHVVLMSRDVTSERLVWQQLDHARELAEQTTRDKSDYLANMSHEIRTPLNGLLGILDLLGTTNLTRRQKKYLALANSSGASLIELINNVLDCDKIESGKCLLRDSDFGLQNLLESVFAMFAAQSAQCEIVLRRRIAKDLPPFLYGDEMKLRQVLINLMGNALKFTRRGMISVEVCRLPYVGAQCDPDGMRLLFIVSDTGVGIGDEELQHIFEKYSRGTDGRCRQVPGTGLGLVIVKKLVKLLGGTIAVESTPGQGTSLYFTVRIQPGREQRDQLEDIDAGRDDIFGALKVLFAEDDSINRLIGGSLLENMGHQVIYAENGCEVMQFLSNDPEVDCILMDIQMPEMDGIEAAARVRRLYQDIGRQPVPIVALTAHALRGDREKFLAAGMDEYITKPYTSADLSMVLNRVCQNRGGVTP